LRLCDLVSRMNKTEAVAPLSLIETLLAVMTVLYIYKWYYGR